MPARLSFEPSVQAVLADVLPDARLVAGDGEALRRRVSRPVLLRATGLGELEGGEIVLVPASRRGQILSSLDDLAAAGISGVVLAGLKAREAVRDAPLVVASLPESADLRAVQQEVERYIVRRRRDLFALEQDLHRELIEAAIGGSDVGQLLEAAARRGGTQAALDREGEVAASPNSAVPLGVLIQARLATRDGGPRVVQVVGPPSALALPVQTGRERRGICLLVGLDQSSLDEAEAVLTSLTSACAIVLGREPGDVTPGLDQLLSSSTPVTWPALREREAAWTALAIEDPGTSARRLERAILLECQARELPCLLARDNETVVALVGTDQAVVWSATVESVRQRLGSEALRAGLSRMHRGVEGAQEAAQEALTALRQGRRVGITPYDEVELQVLLRTLPGGEAFVRARLGPLLDDSPGVVELRRTLGSYLATGRNAREAARVLHVHRNTLLYRLKRIEETLGADLNDPETVFALDLALRALEARQASP